MAWYRALASQKVLNYLRPSDTQLLEKILITARIVLSLKLKTKRTEVWVSGITNTNIKQISCQFLLILLEEGNHGHSSQNN